MRGRPPFPKARSAVIIGFVMYDPDKECVKKVCLHTPGYGSCRHALALLPAKAEVQYRGRIAADHLRCSRKQKLIADFDEFGAGHKRRAASPFVETCKVNKKTIQFFLELVLELRVLQIPRNSGNPLRLRVSESHPAHRRTDFESRCFDLLSTSPFCTDGSPMFFVPPRA